MEPYVIRENEYLAQIAHKLGFDADVVWNDPSNDALRKLRPDPNILLAGDLLHVPEPQQPAVHALAVGTTNTFVSPAPPTVPVCARFVDDDPGKYASRAYTMKELDDLTALATDADGVLRFQAPVTLAVATVVLTDTGESHRLRIGGMDPIDTTVGIFKRLQNLGYIEWGIVFDADAAENNLDVMRDGLRALKAAQAGGEAGADAEPPGSPATSSPEDSPTTEDDAGLSDDGTLSDETKTMLVEAHGY